jgi:putative phosphonate metabolism protein
MTRYALYFAPAEGPFATAAARWLGRDAVTGADRLPIDPALWALTQSARRYGFHATLKAPFRVADGQNLEALIAAMEDFAATQAAVTLDGLQLAALDGFVALIPHGETTALDTFAARVVRDFDFFRAPLTEADIARRNPAGLSARQRGYLDRWGYPHVMDEFQFHMTLTDRLSADQAAWVLPLAEATFAPFLQKPVLIDALTLFVEGADGLFHHHYRAPLLA